MMGRLRKDSGLEETIWFRLGQVQGICHLIPTVLDWSPNLLDPLLEEGCEHQQSLRGLLDPRSGLSRRENGLTEQYLLIWPRPTRPRRSLGLRVGG